ncbi:helix-turn-helix transcriptional regulator [Gilvimarinus algae]|uniref:YafY family protein n=1 Tax=Gilvimarinus algae TaxID=3058037 RepID=A0ABT8THP7_9GAMM|nr:YafY family protein [Gilvimarinus sp. SDUM040014]MDO3383624.1 YafY family protein [Gilvimarinus sp. SDUM040014]
MANTATRLINLIMLLQREPNTPASRLASSLGVSVRTIQRYITMLEDMGVPVYAERGTQGGYSLVRGYRMPPLMLSAEEAVAVYLGTSMVERLWGKLFRPAAESAMTKIESVLPDDQLRDINWARASLLTRGLPRMNPGVDEEWFQALCSATQRCQQLEIVYRSRGSAHPLRRCIDPYALIYSWGQQYCIAFCHRRGEIRSFRVDRIEGLRATGMSFSRPENFNPDDYFSLATSDAPPVDVTLQFPAEHALMARDHPCCWDSLSQNDDGSVTVRFTSSDLEMAACRVMSFLPQARLLSPPPLIELVRKKAAAIACEYTTVIAKEPDYASAHH